MYRRRSQLYDSGSVVRSTAIGNRGFSLLELLMVTAVISILAAMAVPFLQRIRMNSQEKVAIASLRTAHDAQLLHHNRFQRFGELSDLISNAYLDNSFVAGVKAGYEFEVTSNNQASFSLVALPVVVGVTGIRGFWIDETGVIRYSDDGSVLSISRKRSFLDQ